MKNFNSDILHQLKQVDSHKGEANISHDSSQQVPVVDHFSSSLGRLKIPSARRYKTNSSIFTKEAQDTLHPQPKGRGFTARLDKTSCNTAFEYTSGARVMQTIRKLKLPMLIFCCILSDNVCHAATENDQRLVGIDMMRNPDNRIYLFAQGAGVEGSLEARAQYILDVQTRLKMHAADVHAADVLESVYFQLYHVHLPQDYDLLGFLLPVQPQAQPVQPQAQPVQPQAQPVQPQAVQRQPSDPMLQDRVLLITPLNNIQKALLASGIPSEINLSDIAGFTNLPENGLDDEAMSNQSQINQKVTFLKVANNLAGDAVKEFLVNIKMQSVENSISHISDTLSTVIAERMDLITSPSFSPENTNAPIALSSMSRISGVSAGDDNEPMAKGLWISGLYGQSAKAGMQSAYKGKMSGGTIGFDLNPTNTSLVGIAYSNIFSRFNYKNMGNKINAKTHSISIYAQQELDNLVFRGMLSYLRSNVTANINKDFSGNRLAVAKSKFNNNSVSGELTAGYKINNNLGLMIMPNIGIRLSHFQDDAYKEKGTGVLNLQVKDSSSQKITGIAGIKLIAPRALESGILITPSLNLSMEKYVHSKKTKPHVKFQWMDNYFNSQPKSKPASIGYNIGTGLAAQHKNLELSANYNCHLEKKYKSHQGALKVKLLF
jgi:hypothetical protein